MYIKLLHNNNWNVVIQALDSLLREWIAYIFSIDE